MKGKKGLSDVVVTLLIVLISIAAVSILWAVLKPTITKQAGEVSTNCMNTEISIDKCITGTTGAVTLTTTKGAVANMTITYLDGSGATIGNTYIVPRANIPGALTTVTITPTPIPASSVSSVKVGYGITGEKGCGFETKSCTA